MESTYGMILIEVDEYLYAISLGRAHSIANNFADIEFGFDIAEIIHDSEKIDVKSAKFFKQSKNKSLTQYNRNSYVTTEIGESHEMLISKIVFPPKYSQFVLSKYEEGLKFGSTVKINVRTYKPQEIIEIVAELHYLLNNEDKTGSLPRMNFVKNNEDNKPLISDLNSELLKELKAEDSKVSLSYFMEDDGDIIIRPANDEKIEIVYASKRHPINSYTIESIGGKLKEIECEDISKVSIKTISEKDKRISLLKMVDFSTNLRNKDYCLFKGRWASFNKSYIDYIASEIKKVNQISSYNEAYSLTDDILEAGRKIQLSNPKKYDGGVKYAEYPFNIYLEDKHQYTLLDRKKGQLFYKNVEFADLYDDKQKSLIHLKIGETSSLRYCIQQSLHSAELYNSQGNVLNPYGINEIKKISMIFIVTTSNLIGKEKQIDFSKNASIYFKIEIIEWLTTVRSLGFTPEIIVAKDLRVFKK
ncbi:DUF6119 family protein [Paenibacillus sp. FSL H3-0457]|uniref:DUF6119 family protein n=1 Tax=Paenibacillus sp. FSL H3-0457 TaxID=2921430 RepID=UPI0030EECA23